MMQNKSRLSRVELLGAAIPFLLYLALPMGEVFPSLALYWGGAVILRQNWPVWFQWHAVVEATLIGVTSTACTWFWVMVIVFLPALFGLRPRSTRLPTATHL